MLATPFYFMNQCLDCGDPYSYDPSNPLGASAERCSACRKRETTRRKKIILFSVASWGYPIRCAKCGYDRSVNALQLMDARAYLHEPKTQEEKEKRAKEQYILCLNCAAEVKFREVEAKAIIPKDGPPMVEFYETKVTVVKQKLPTFKERTQDAIEAEVVTDAPEGTKRAHEVTRRISTSEVPDVPIDV